jgi:uncharacterized protein YaaN involved in tellurite resistance
VPSDDKLQKPPLDVVEVAHALAEVGIVHPRKLRAGAVCRPAHGGGGVETVLENVVLRFVDEHQVLENHQIQLLKDVATLDKMYDLNLTYFKELSMYIAAGKKRLEEVRNGELKELQEKAAQTGDAQDAQNAKDFGALCDRFEKKLHDLELTRQIAIQTGPQIRLVQDSDTLMAEKIQSTIVNTIPLWKNQMVLALGIEDSTKAAKAEAAVTEMTNKLLTSNAEKLKTATIETAKASERGVVDMETLRRTNEMLVSTLDEVARIQSEGREKRAQAEIELATLESELKNKLLSMNS